MSADEDAATSTAVSETATTTTAWESAAKAQPAIRYLSSILGALPDSLTYSETPAHSLLHDPDIGKKVSTRLRHPTSGVGDDNLCRWLYDTFQSMEPDLQLVVLRFVPTVAGIYLSRAVLRKPLAGFEAVLLSLYAHETKVRGGQPQIVNIPSMSHPSLYHEAPKNQGKNRALDLHIALISSALEPHGTVRATKRARIVGVVLELYYSKICHMPISSKVEFCEFCMAWAGKEGCDENEEGNSIGNDRGEECSNTSTGGDEESGEKGGRIPLPWELFQPIVRIIGHCLLGPWQSTELKSFAMETARCLYARAMHDMLPQAILATRSLLRLGKVADQDSDLSFLMEIRDPEPVVATST